MGGACMKNIAGNQTYRDNITSRYGASLGISRVSLAFLIPDPHWAVYPHTLWMLVGFSVNDFSRYPATSPKLIDNILLNAGLSYWKILLIGTWAAAFVHAIDNKRSRVSDPDMHHGTCVTHVPWCMPVSLTTGFLWSRPRGESFPAFPAHAQLAILRIW